MFMDFQVVFQGKFRLITGGQNKKKPRHSM
jgi:hypothetical protein